MKSDRPDKIIQRPRRIPFTLEKKVEVEISRLLKLGIIEQVDASSCLSPIVPVQKGDGIRSVMRGLSKNQ